MSGVVEVHFGSRLAIRCTENRTFLCDAQQTFHPFRYFGAPRDVALLHTVCVHLFFQ